MTNTAPYEVQAPPPHAYCHATAMLLPCYKASPALPLPLAPPTSSPACLPTGVQRAGLVKSKVAEAGPGGVGRPATGGAAGVGAGAGGGSPASSGHMGKKGGRHTEGASKVREWRAETPSYWCCKQKHLPMQKKNRFQPAGGSCASTTCPVSPAGGSCASTTCPVCGASSSCMQVSTTPSFISCTMCAPWLWHRAANTYKGGHGGKG